MDTIVKVTQRDMPAKYRSKKLRGGWQYDTARFAKVEYHPNGKVKSKTYLDKDLKPVSDGTGTIAFATWYENGNARESVYCVDEKYVEDYYHAGEDGVIGVRYGYYPSGALRFAEYWEKTPEDGKIRQINIEYYENGVKFSRESLNLARQPDDSPNHFAWETYDRKGRGTEALSFKDGVRQPDWPYKI